MTLLNRWLRLLRFTLKIQLTAGFNDKDQEET